MGKPKGKKAGQLSTWAGYVLLSERKVGQNWDYTTLPPSGSIVVFAAMSVSKRKIDLNNPFTGHESLQ